MEMRTYQSPSFVDFAQLDVNGEPNKANASWEVVAHAPVSTIKGPAQAANLRFTKFLGDPRLLTSKDQKVASGTGHGQLLRRPGVDSRTDGQAT